MTMNRFFRKSKETPADEVIVATGAQQPLTPQQESEASTINALLKATQGGLDTTAIRERRLSIGMVDPLKAPPARRLSPEAQAINNMIKASETEGTRNVVQKRRKSLDSPPPTSGPDKRSLTDSSNAAPNSVKFEKVKDGTDADEAVQPIDTKSCVGETEEINRRIAHDRMIRRVSKELTEAEQAAMKRIHALQTAVTEAEATAETKADAQYASLGAAAARGAAKAAAKAAGGRFLSKEEWESMQGKLAELEGEVAELKADQQKSRDVFNGIAQHFKGADASPTSSPMKKRGSTSFKSISFKRGGGFEDDNNASGHGRSFVQRMLEGSGDNLIARLTRSGSGSLRRSGSSSFTRSGSGSPSPFGLRLFGSSGKLSGLGQSTEAPMNGVPVVDTANA